MFNLRIAALCKEKGIRQPFSAMNKAGISVTKAMQYLSGKTTRLMVGDAEKLCRLLRCTPNDLFAWTPDSKADDYPENPLQAIRQKPPFDLEEKLKGMSLEEVKKRFEG